MKRIFALSILVVIILGSIGAVGNENNNNGCGCTYTNEEVEPLPQGSNSAEYYSIDQLCTLQEPENWRDTATFMSETDSGLLGDPPSSFDWRDQGGVTPIRDQKGCGSCWAFATMGVMESQVKRGLSSDVDLSEQWLVRCNTNNYGCDGGWFAFPWLCGTLGKCGGTGAILETDYPYTATDGGCQPCDQHTHRYLGYGFEYVSSGHNVPDTDDIKSAIYTYGPVAAAVYVDSAFHSYSGGIFRGSASGQCNHSIVLVGWNDAEGYWILRNSWGTGWGENGYMRIGYGCQQVGYAACYIKGYYDMVGSEIPVAVKIKHITNHPDDGNFEPIDVWPSEEPEWYYFVYVDTNGDGTYDSVTETQQKNNADNYDWISSYRWSPNHVHTFTTTKSKVNIKIELYDRDLVFHDKANIGFTSTEYNIASSTVQSFSKTGSGNDNAHIEFDIFDLPIAEAGGPYEGIKNLDIEFTGAVVSNSGVPSYTYKWDFDNDGSFDDGTGATVTYKWSSTGEKNIAVQVTDSNGYSSVDKATVTVKNNENIPSKPTLSGPSSGKPDTSYSFTAKSTDDDSGDQIYYYFDWGDDTNSGWVGPYDSGDFCTKSHKWSSMGSYQVKVRAKDSADQESSWSDPLTITMPKGKTANLLNLYKLLEIYPFLKILLYSLLS